MRLQVTAIRWQSWIPLGLMIQPSMAWCHAFGRTHTLPVPVWLYMYGAAIALLLSLVLFGILVHQNPSIHSTGLKRSRPLDVPSTVLQWGSLVGLGFTILAGFVGNQNAYFNFNMTFFWIICLLGLFYLSAVIGDIFRLINPWRALVEILEQVWPQAFAGRRLYPEQWGCYPALLLYMSLIWVELFTSIPPWGLSTLLLAYTVLNLLAAWWWGQSDWFEKGELFGVLFGVVARMASIQWARLPKQWILQHGTWCHGILQASCAHFSSLLFIVFMLSSTAFDGLKETSIWKLAYWGQIYPVLAPALGENISILYPVLKQLAILFDTLAMLLTWAFYGGLYVLTMVGIRWLTGTQMTVLQLSLNFAYSLIPIAFVYNLAHYFTLLFTQGVHILRLLIDPFAWGWNPMNIKSQLPDSVFLDGNWIWHIQVLVIVLGHVLSVYLAHQEAMRVFTTRRHVILSQFPIMLLMIFLTSFGLWVMAQPVSPGNRF